MPNHQVHVETWVDSADASLVPLDGNAFDWSSTRQAVDLLTVPDHYRADSTESSASLHTRTLTELGHTDLLTSFCSQMTVSHLRV